jgi:hypothetical protein
MLATSLYTLGLRCLLIPDVLLVSMARMLATYYCSIGLSILNEVPVLKINFS